MGRAAGQPARVADVEPRADRPQGGVKPARPVLEAVRPKAPIAPRAPASSPPPAPVSGVAPKVSSTPVPPSARAVSPAPVSVRPAAPPTPATPATPAPAPAKAAKNEGTVREILPPWHVLQEKLQKGQAPVALNPANEVVNRAAQEALAAQEAANATWGTADESVDIPPSSGVRVSDPGHEPHAVLTPPQAGQVPDSLLTFKVYTLAELERRSDAPVSMRASRLNFDLTSSRSTLHWQRVRTAFVAFVTASVAWFKTTKTERPSIKVALRQPFDALGDELQVAVEAIDWKKLGVTTGIVVGATLTLLFAVLTAAELTDDLKSPGSGSHLASSESSLPSRTALDKHGVAPATNMAAMGVQPVPAPVVIEPPPPATTVIGDIDAPSTDAPATPAKKPGVKKAAAKKAPNKLTLRSAPF